MRCANVALAVALCLATCGAAVAAPGGKALTALSRERLVFQTQYGDIHMAFYPNVRQHPRRWNTSAGVGSWACTPRTTSSVSTEALWPAGGHQRRAHSTHERSAAGGGLPHPPSGGAPGCEAHQAGHPQHGARRRPPQRRQLLLRASGCGPHLDMQYSVFGEVTQGLETLAKFEELPTKTEGIFVMPLERITILSTYSYVVDDQPASRLGEGSGQKLCSEVLASLQGRFDAQSAQIEKIRKERLPGR